MVALLASLLAVAAVYIVILGVRHARRQERSHRKFNTLATLLENAYGGHVEAQPEAGEARSQPARRDGERGLG
jgi:uncharacterized membrane protein YccC